jgi:hypothetical protein
MAEVLLPAGIVPGIVFGVYRLAEFDAQGDPLNQPKAFNYWRPPASGGIAQLVVDTPTQARVIGLRVGLGRAVAVVVVAEVAGATQVLGAMTARRAAFVDGPLGATLQPLDPNALALGPPPPPTIFMQGGGRYLRKPLGAFRRIRGTSAETGGVKGTRKEEQRNACRHY